MRNHSVIYIEQPVYEKADKPLRCKDSLLSHFTVDIRDIPERIVTSFIPPIFTEKSKKVYVDLIGPLIALLSLSLLLHYGHVNKHPAAAMEVSPTYVLFYYTVSVPVVCYGLVKVGGSNLVFADILALLGYGLYGHLFTIGLSLLLGNESNNLLFFFLMAVLGGFSGLRIVIVLLITIPRPVARLLVCSIVSIVHLLFLIFIHFAYMHRTFVYGADMDQDY